MHWYFIPVLFPLLLAGNAGKSYQKDNSISGVSKHIGNISVPAGYSRIGFENDSFASWLRSIELKNDKTVYLYNGLAKRNQTAQYAVLNIPVGNKDLQQCADAVMRLRASYLFDKKRMKEIVFYDNNNKAYPYSGSADPKVFSQYLEKVFAYCGTASLEKQLKKKNIMEITAGDVFIKGGFPGHAVIVMDIATNSKGEKMYMLAQSYMPAQDIHVLNNPRATSLSPWYTVKNEMVITPEWTFQPTQLFGW